MKRNIKRWLSVACLAIFFGWMLWQRPEVAPILPAAPDPNASELSVAVSRAPGRTAPRQSDRDELLRNSDVIFVANRLAVEPGVVADRAIKTKAIMDSKNVEIRFFGKVVDQDDAPLAGVTIKAGVREWTLKNLFEPVGARHYQTQVTGPDGLFTFNSLRGDVLDIEQMHKDGYVATTRQKRGFSYGPMRHHFVPNPLDPVVYRMWKTNGAVRMYRVSFSGVLPQDGTIVPFDLVRSKRATQAGFDTDVRVALQHFAPPEQRGFSPRFPWRFTIEVPDGGLIESRDEFMYLAPESGYQSRWVAEFAKDDPGWNVRREVEFYLRNRAGQQHGWLKVKLKVDPGGNGYFSIDGFLNPTGRVLESAGQLPLFPPPLPRPTGQTARPPARGLVFPPRVGPVPSNQPATPNPQSSTVLQVLTNHANPFPPRQR